MLINLPFINFTDNCSRTRRITYDLSLKPVAKAVQNFCKRLQACAFKAGGHFEHSMWPTLC